MKRRVITSLLCAGAFFYAQSQSVSTMMGGRAAGMGYASSVLADEAVLFNNPGALAHIRKPSSFFAFEASPALPGASRTAAGFSWPAKVLACGFGFFRFGDDRYREQIVSGGISNKFGITSLGVKLNYVQYSVEGYETKGALSIDFGGLAQITPQITVGAYILNLNQAKISADETLPVKLVAGLGIQPEAYLVIVTEVEKDISYHVTWRTGAEYAIHKRFFVRTGFNLNPAAGYFGLGAQARRLKIDYAIKFNMVLGGTHHASAVYQFERRTHR